MIEAGAKEVPEDDMFNALMEAHEELKKVCAFIQSIKDEIGTVSYTHLDVYKRQALIRFMSIPPVLFVQNGKRTHNVRPYGHL